MMTTWCFSNGTISLGTVRCHSPRQVASYAKAGSICYTSFLRGRKDHLDPAQLKQVPLFANLTAQQSCSLYVIQKTDLEQLMFQHKDLAYELLWTFVRTLSARLRETNDKIKAFFAISARF